MSDETGTWDADDIDALSVLEPDVDWDGWDASAAQLDDISRLLAVRRHLTADIRTYDRMEMAELQRLRAARERALGPTERRLAWIEDEIKRFAVATWRRTNKTRWATPNGIIASRSRVHEITIDNEDLVLDGIPDESELLLGGDPLFEIRTKIFVKQLRKLLDQLVADKKLTRLVLDGDPLSPDASYLVDEEEGWTREFSENEHGYWMKEDGLLVSGVRWSPVGTDGTGRSFTLDEPDDLDVEETS
jgi:hypothetical protein